MAKEHQDGSAEAAESQGGDIPPATDAGTDVIEQTEPELTEEEIKENEFYDGISPGERSKIEAHGLGREFGHGANRPLGGRQGLRRRGRGRAFRG